MNFTPSLADVLQSADILIAAAIAEDIGSGDVTSLAVFPPHAMARATIIAKEPGVVAGLPVAKAVFAKADPHVVFTPALTDGAHVKPMDVLVNLEGKLISLLSLERIVLNFLQHLSGIATLASEFVRAVQGTKAVILDSRKTTPGYRALEKYAVRTGGAQNHRRGLYDMMMVKDNHIQAVKSLSLAVRRARESYPDLPLEVEVDSLEHLKEALSLPVDRILLDNMDLATIHQGVLIANNRVPLEVSGGVTLDNVRKIAETGVNFISVGALTHSAPGLDISLEITS
ncbi:MAG: nicotinate-nucleotide diphosphorylase (carboxylating) [Chloroflexi bacterium RBG_13_60_9]|nr:MAG: nicotinate-nucleotide diphosphorylase (carboxylating) [Chloroflexi bacterium RBG_13_60_9]